ncbi:polysaccharide biosynthesis tyrosine autokinase [Acidipropionibacterium acidipropionici]|uniref:polysaccharide biosynthesis tyrosine autokinase n=1 Tax=Acidipropionibacterium acidipropionici TaxID=1748 RepID=UPI0004275EA6|nr:polysaccharide biosynthesis tyrosine autokinase [Acidipropionibacterium acidipropionici]ALN14218.1 hypothetical protein ASQ49_01905 [Acidipropionibacterium acidipropionici]APZ10022.1 hypothetical protein BWX38_13055 [Acidipropionibacterium acidipropionici]
MTLHDFLRLIRRQLGVIVTLTLVGAALAAGALMLQSPRYTAHASGYVRVSVPQSAGGTTDSNSYYSASQLAAQKAKAFVAVFTSQTVASLVRQELGLSEEPSELASRITATNAANSLTIDVTATASSPDLARRIADSVVNQSAAQVRRLEGTGSPVSIVMMSPASLAEIDVSPTPLKYLAGGLLAGLLVGLLVALARQRLDTRLRTSQDVSERFDSPVLASLPRSAGIARTGERGGDFQAEESLRKLRTNLRYTGIDHPNRIILVTSPCQGDGKSSVAAGLARVMAAAGDDVILVDADLRRPTIQDTFGVRARLGLPQVLVDADLRRPTIQDTFGVRARLGLPQVLVGAAGLDQVLRTTDTDGLTVLTSAGSPPPNPTELLGSKRMAELLGLLAGDHVVILDAPPVLPVADALILAGLADTVLLVIGSGNTRSDQLEQSIAAIGRAGGRTTGIVLNRVPSSRLARLRYGDTEYGYGYASEGHTESHAGNHPQDAVAETLEPPRVSGDRVVAGSRPLRRAQREDRP